MKLTAKQHEALEWLSKNGRWTDAWWGGRPHSGWPKEMSARTFDSLLRMKLIRTRMGERFERTVQITRLGQEALLA